MQSFDSPTDEESAALAKTETLVGRGSQPRPRASPQKLRKKLLSPHANTSRLDCFYWLKLNNLEHQLLSLRLCFYLQPSSNYLEIIVSRRRLRPVSRHLGALDQVNKNNGRSGR